jgi:two-component sensor histidine kinase
MLAVMIHQARRDGRRYGVGRESHAQIPLLAAILGLIWNLGALIAFGWHDLAHREPSAWLTALSYSALGFLPAVVVDASTRSPDHPNRPGVLALVAYAVSAAATVAQGVAAITGTSSRFALLTLTLGYAAVLVAMLLHSWRSGAPQRTVAAASLAAFAASAHHLSHHAARSDSWPIEMLGDQASLPLVLVILYQDYRFALADLFLKRAFAILTLVAIAFGMYTAVAPMMDSWTGTGVSGPVAIVGLWVLTALAYPAIRRAGDRFVDRVVLKRPDDRQLRAELMRRLPEARSASDVMATASDSVSAAVSARAVSWDEDDTPHTHEHPLAMTGGESAVTVAIPVAQAPGYRIQVGALSSGRRLLSDDLDLLETIALMAARRIDEIRVQEERRMRDLREHEMRRLAAEAELQALRAQLNPHFLFNALTTIGYLAQTAPMRAVETVQQLTVLLRAVLSRVVGDTVPLLEELQIVDSYLAIESARFEERLRIEKRIQEGIEDVMVPPLVIQPLVENAVKHGIAPQRHGGVVSLEVIADRGRGVLSVTVGDSGSGMTAREVERSADRGVGISNIRRRLGHYFGSAASLEIQSVAGEGTRVVLTIPLATDAPGTRMSTAAGGVQQELKELERTGA